MRDPIVLERRLSDVLAGMFVGAGLMLFLNGAPFCNRRRETVPLRRRMWPPAAV